MKEKWYALSRQKRNRLQLGMLVIFAWIIYTFAISNTLALRAQCNTIEQCIDSSVTAPDELMRLESELNSLNAATGLNTKNTSDTSVHELLLDLVTNYCSEHELHLREFQSPIRYRANEWEVETHPFTVEGSYRNLVLLLEELKQNAPGKVVSVNFFTKADNKTKTVALQATIYVQNLIAAT